MIDFNLYPFAKNDVVYDIETYPNVFTCSFYEVDTGKEFVYEVSKRNNDLGLFLKYLGGLKRNNKRMVGFNNLGFDYPVIHWIIEKAISSKRNNEHLYLTSNQIYKYAMRVINSHKDDGFGIRVKDDDIKIKQVDLYKLNHFDNDAKRTSLKLLEFNMRSENIEDLPYAVGSKLTNDEIDTLIEYNKHDVKETFKFYCHCLSAIAFREDLSAKYGFDCTNLNDTKIGEQFFMRKIEAENPTAFYEHDFNGKRKMKQTKRDHIIIKDCLFDYIRFQRPEFNSILNWLRKQVITETKGVFSDIEEHNLGEVAKYADMVIKREKFKVKPTRSDIAEFKIKHPKGWVEEVELKAMEIVKDSNGNPVKEEYVCEKTGKPKLRNRKVPKKSYYGCYKVAESLNVVIDGFQYVYGVGGIHGSTCGLVEANDEYEIVDWDVASYYPNMAISNRIYPEHLNESFCDSYEAFYNERGNYAKGTGENLAIKLGLNATYGNSNNKFSPFYDPKYTMSITIGGQLSLCMLIERLLIKCGVKVIQANTDGFTVLVKKDKVSEMNDHVKRWEKVTGLVMEDSHYSSMYIADVNNYIAVYTSGKLKTKGRYDWKDLAWHKNMSNLVAPMAVQNWVETGQCVEDFIRNHREPYDFMLRAKLPRSMKLVVEKDGVDLPQQNICRYYVSTEGGQMVKIMPPLEDKDEWRRMNLESGWKVKTCNNMKDFTWDIDYEYYIQEAKKLVEPFLNKVFEE